MNRRFVRIIVTAAQIDSGTVHVYTAIATDGSAWEAVATADTLPSQYNWKRIPDLPQEAA